jgi:hypothetical protein
VTNEKNAGLADLRPREWVVIVPIVVTAILMGVLPNLFLRPIEPSVGRVLNRYHRGAATEIRAEFGTQDLGFVERAWPVAAESGPTTPERRTPNFESAIPHRGSRR